MAAFDFSKNRNERAIIRLFQTTFWVEKTSRLLSFRPAGGAILLGLHRKNRRFRPQHLNLLSVMVVK
jgi:hypothetical protein